MREFIRVALHLLHRLNNSIVFFVPGCASLQYLQEDNLAVQLSFGDNILTSTIVNGKYVVLK